MSILEKFEEIAWCKGAQSATKMEPQRQHFFSGNPADPTVDNIPYAVDNPTVYHDALLQRYDRDNDAMVRDEYNTICGVCAIGAIHMDLGAFDHSLNGAETLSPQFGKLPIPQFVRFQKLLRSYGTKRAQKVFKQWVEDKREEFPLSEQIEYWYESGENIEGWNDRKDTTFDNISDFLEYLDRDELYSQVRDVLMHPANNEFLTLWNNYQRNFPWGGIEEKLVDEFGNPYTVSHGQVKLEDSFDWAKGTGMTILDSCFGVAHVR